MTCCKCGCKYCGSEDNIIKVYVCSFVRCHFQSQDLSDVQDHKAKKHLTVAEAATTSAVETLEVKAEIFADDEDDFEDEEDIYKGSSLEIQHCEVEEPDVTGSRTTSSNLDPLHSSINASCAASPVGSEASTEDNDWMNDPGPPLPMESLIKNHQNISNLQEYLDTSQNGVYKKYIYKKLNNTPNPRRKYVYGCKQCSYTNVHSERVERHLYSSHIKKNFLFCPACDFKTGHTHFLKHHFQKYKVTVNIDNRHRGLIRKPKSLKVLKMDVDGKEPVDDKSEVVQKYDEDKSTLKEVVDTKVHTSAQLKSFEKHAILCDLCGFNAENPSSMKKHIEAKHGSFMCDKCDYVANEKRFLTHHQQTYHPPTCDTCCLILNVDEQRMGNHDCPAQLGPGFIDPNETTTKTKKAGIYQDENGLRICAICGFKSKKLTVLEKHKVFMHSDHECRFCGYRTTQRPALLKHLKNEHTLSCDNCPFKAESAEELEGHICPFSGKSPSKKITSGPLKRLQCSYCPYTTLESNFLRNHENTIHLKLPKKLPCHLCDRRFNFNSELKQHIEMIHERIKKLQCPKCEFKAYRTSNIKKHMLKHGGPELQCHLCDYKTDHLGNMQRHRRAEHNSNTNSMASDVAN